MVPVPESQEQQLPSSAPQGAQPRNVFTPTLLIWVSQICKGKERKTDFICFLMQSESPQGPCPALPVYTNCCGCGALRVSGFPSPDTAQW